MMAILASRQTRVIVQGITGNEGRFHARQCKEYGTRVVAGVTPGKGGQQVDGIPVFDTVRRAVEERPADASLIFVPPRFAADAILEALDAGIGLIVCITEGIPVRDMVRVKDAFDRSDSRLIGPNCPGVITPEQCKIGIMPAVIHRAGPVGVISRSGTLTYEVVDQLSRREIGQSTCVGIGGDPILGSTFLDILRLFRDDADTEAVVLIGEIGGSAEEEAAAFIQKEFEKPIIAFIAGKTAPPGRRMGHAGAIIAGGRGTAEEKIRALESAGVTIAPSPAEIGETVQRVLERNLRS
jgi:succinyl-CoA synthetase alpha subunit